MGLRFRKSFGFGPFRTTISKSGISTSAGVKGARVTKRADGKIQTTTSIPGTGVWYVKEHSSAQPQKEKSNRVGSLAVLVIIILIIWAVLFGCSAENPKENENLLAPVTTQTENPTEPEPQKQKIPEADNAPTKSPETTPAPNPAPQPKLDSEPAPSEPIAAGVIGNKNSKKFHALGCSSIGDMKESNKISIASYDEAISMGYEPCKRCH